jgi:hypothetical protein
MKHHIVLASVALALTTTGALAAVGCGSEIAAEVARDRQLDTDMAALTHSGVPGVALVIRDGGNTTRLAQGFGDVATRRTRRAGSR